MFQARLFSGIAASASVAAVASVTAFASTTPAHASAVIPGNPVAFGNATATGTGTGASSAWTLNTGTPAGSAQLQLVNPPDLSATSAQPTFNLLSGNAVGGVGTVRQPRWVIQLHNGCTIEGSQNVYMVSGPNGSSGSTTTATNTTWANARNIALGNPPPSPPGGTPTCDKEDTSTTAAFIMANSPSGAAYQINDVFFDGIQVIRDVAPVTETTTGRIRNFASGKCLDVRGGRFTTGAPLQQWACGAMGSGVAGGNQNFRIVTRADGVSYLLVRSPSGAIWGVEPSGANGNGPLELSVAPEPMTKLGPRYTWQVESPARSTSEVNMTSTGRANGDAVTGEPLQSPVTDSQRWHLPE